MGLINFFSSAMHLLKRTLFSFHYKPYHSCQILSTPLKDFFWKNFFLLFGAPSPTRTGNLRIRSPLLYPIELWAQTIVLSCKCGFLRLKTSDCFLAERLGFPDMHRGRLLIPPRMVWRRDWDSNPGSAQGEHVLSRHAESSTLASLLQSLTRFIFRSIF